MKRLLMSVLIPAVVLAFGACVLTPHAQEPAGGKRVRYVFLTNHTGKSFAEVLRYVIFSYKGKGGHNILQYLPEATEQISFDVYHANYAGLPNPISVTFSNYERKDNRKTHAQDFLAKINQLAISTDPADDDILHQLVQIKPALLATDEMCTLFISGDLATCSGGGIDARPNNFNWLNGDFRFINASRNMVPAELDEANRQISDRNSWIYRHLIDFGLKHDRVINAHTKIYFNCEPGNSINCVDPGRSTEEIRDFWIK